MFIDLILKPLEATLNRLCQCDECFFQKLTPYRGRSIRLQSRYDLWQLDCVIGRDAFYLSAADDKTPDVTLVLSPQFVFEWLKQPQNPLVFFSNAYEVRGDMEFAETLKKIFVTLDIDLEEQLSRVLGDALATNLCQGAKHVSGYAADVARGLGRQVRDYLQEEQALLVPPVLVEEFIAHTQILRDDVERLAVRIDRLCQQMEKA